MALIFMESFDHYSIIGEKWTTQRGNPSAALDLTTGRFGTYAWYANSRYLTKLLGTNYATLICGVAINFQSTGWGDTDAVINFKDSGSQQVELWYNMSSGLWSVKRAGTTVASATNLISAASFHFIEFLCTIHNSAGAARVRVDGTEIITATSLDTQNTANAYVNELRLGSATDDYRDWRFDDLHLIETAGGGIVDFIGDCRVQAILPNANGTTSNLDGSDGNSTDNYLLVDENPPDGNTTYVESGDVGDKDTYNYPALAAATGTVYGVQILPQAIKTDAGAREIKTVARLSATEEDGPAVALGTSYIYEYDVRETKPGGGAWTITDVNAAEFGVKVSG